MIRLEQVVNQMSPLIDTELERVDRKHAQLTQLSGDLVDAINLYHTLMRDSDRPISAGFPMGFNQNQPMGFSGTGPMSLPSMYGNPMYQPGMMPGIQQQYPPGYGPPQSLDNMPNMPNMQNGHASQFIQQQGFPNQIPTQMIPPQSISQMAPPSQQQLQPQLNIHSSFQIQFPLNEI